MNGHDTKRIITQGGIDSLPFGHYASYKERYYFNERVRAKHYNGIIAGVGGRSVTYTVRKTLYWRICIGMLTT